MKKIFALIMVVGLCGSCTAAVRLGSLNGNSIIPTTNDVGNISNRVVVLEQSVVSAPVTSVNGSTGVVVITAASIGAATGTPLYVESDPAWNAGTGALWSAISARASTQSVAQVQSNLTALGVSLTNTQGDVSSLIGNISNSYVVIAGTTLSYEQSSPLMEYVDTTKPIYRGSSGSYLVFGYHPSVATTNPCWVYSLLGDLDNNPSFDSNRINSYLPPFSGYVPAEGGINSPDVEFHGGTIADETALRITTDATITSNLVVVSNQITSVKSNLTGLGASLTNTQGDVTALIGFSNSYVVVNGKTLPYVSDSDGRTWSTGDYSLYVLNGNTWVYDGPGTASFTNSSFLSSSLPPSGIYRRISGTHDSTNLVIEFRSGNEALEEAARIAAITGNSYMSINGTNILYNSIWLGKPEYANTSQAPTGTFHFVLWQTNHWEYITGHYPLIVYTNLAQTLYPPSTGWLNQTGEITDILLKIFNAPSLADETALRIATDATITSNLVVVSNQITSVKSNLTGYLTTNGNGSGLTNLPSDATKVSTNGNGYGITNLNAANLTGTLPTNVIPTNITVDVSGKANVDGSNIGTNAAGFCAAIGALTSITNWYAVTNLYAAVRTIDDAAEDELNWIPCTQVGQVGTSISNTLSSDFPQFGSAQCWLDKLGGNQRAVFKIPSNATKVRSTCFFYGWQTNVPTDGVRIGYYIDYFTATNTVLDNSYTVTWSSTNIYAVYTNTLLSSALNSKCSFFDLYSYGSSFTGGLVTNNVPVYILRVEAYIPRTSFRVLETSIIDSQERR